MIAVVTGSSGFIGARLLEARVWGGWNQALMEVTLHAHAAPPQQRHFVASPRGHLM